MKIVSLIISCLFCCISYAQNLTGLWKGSMYLTVQTPDKGTPIYLQLDASSEGKVTGQSRTELYDKDEYALKSIQGIRTGLSLSISEQTIAKKTTKIATGACRNKFELTYNHITGYLEGTYIGTDCKTAGKIILYRVEGTFPSEANNPESHFWFDQLGKDLKKGFSAPEIRKKERENFIFQPIYFDYDKSDIKAEYENFLNAMIRVVESHSDLRVRVIGHTDSDGSDLYNDGLSKRRAQAIIDYFVKKGLSADRLEFDFKGEKQPVDTNNTPEGRQRNRRVDFQFI